MYNKKNYHKIFNRVNGETKDIHAVQDFETLNEIQQISVVQIVNGEAGEGSSGDYKVPQLNPFGSLYRGNLKGSVLLESRTEGMSTFSTCPRFCHYFIQILAGHVYESHLQSR